MSNNSFPFKLSIQQEYFLIGFCPKLLNEINIESINIYFF